MDCVYDCKPHITSFAFRSGDGRGKNGDIDVERGTAGKITRRDFMSLMFLSLFMSGFRGVKSRTGVIRPPGAQNEDKLLNLCIRCGNCKKVCVTNALQPVMFEAGLGGIWTPQLVPEIGYCEYNCNLCGNVCPTGAIPSLSLKEKQHTALGTAKVNRGICLAWAYNEECLVCEEHCPIPEKAIKIVKDTVSGKMVLKPVVDKSLCIGCGICQNKCPARPDRAIKVLSKNI